LTFGFIESSEKIGLYFFVNKQWLYSFIFEQTGSVDASDYQDDHDAMVNQSKCGLQSLA
jgi:hypothetical protein